MCTRCDKDGYCYEYREVLGYSAPLLFSVLCDCGKNNQLKFQAKVSQSGVGESFNNYTFEKFKTYTGELEKIKEKAITYVQEFDKNQFNKSNGLIVCGKVGSGKTHIASAVSNALMRKGYDLEYFEYRERINKLKQSINDYQEYKKMMESIKNVKILFIDDLFKGKVTEAETNAVYEVINNRYQRNLPLIITTEKKPQELLAIDEAIGSRIMEICKQNIIVVSSVENYRLKE